MAVVAVLRRQSVPEAGFAVPAAARRMLWAAAVLDVMTVAWMLSAGDWLDGASRVSAVATLGGHHGLVLWLAVVGFATLAVMATLTRSFTSVSRWQFPFLSLAVVVSMVATGGALSVAILLVGGLLAVAVIGWAVLR